MVLMLQNSWRMKSLAVATIEDNDDCQQLGVLSVYSDDTERVGLGTLSRCSSGRVSRLASCSSERSRSAPRSPRTAGSTSRRQANAAAYLPKREGICRRCLVTFISVPAETATADRERLRSVAWRCSPTTRRSHSAAYWA
jgi:hypothetical protein